MTWITGIPEQHLLAALSADIAREAAAAADYLQLARWLKPLHSPAVRQHIAACAAAALSDATALAAELVALGGVPPALFPSPRATRTAPKPVDRYVEDARSAVAHYRNRMRMARRLGLLRLQEVFSEIMRNKRTHLGNAAALAAAAPSAPAPKGHKERTRANRSPYE
jgi:hypothetical protein